MTDKMSARSGAPGGRSARHHVRVGCSLGGKKGRADKIQKISGREESKFPPEDVRGIERESGDALERSRKSTPGWGTTMIQGSKKAEGMRTNSSHGKKKRAVVASTVKYQGEGGAGRKRRPWREETELWGFSKGGINYQNEEINGGGGNWKKPKHGGLYEPRGLQDSGERGGHLP